MLAHLSLRPGPWDPTVICILFVWAPTRPKYHGTQTHLLFELVGPETLQITLLLLLGIGGRDLWPPKETITLSFQVLVS